VFYTNKRFILTESLNLTSERCEAITKTIDSLFANEQALYIVLRDIAEEWFSTLPIIDIGTSWTALLLQEVLRLHPDIGYRIIFPGLEGQAHDTLGAAIIQDKSEINSFADVVYYYCFDKTLTGEKMPTENLRVYLRNAGMIDGNELICNLHKALMDYRFAFSDENKKVKILERQSYVWLSVDR
jgi:hypothetical protein